MEVWQREHIRVNLPNLIKTTICSEMFLSHLYAAKVISSEEVDILKHTRNGQEKTGKFYDIIQTRSQSYSLLQTALQDTNQTGAYDILHNYKTQYKLFGAISYCRAMLIGRGSYGTMVYRGRFDNRDVAVKVINADYMDLRRAHKEVQFMRDLGSHDNIVKYHMTEETEDFVLIALELCDTNLHDWVTKSKSVMDHDIINILRQVTTGVVYLHSRKIVHRDMKPANILLLCSDGKELQVKISDFGVSKRVPDVNSVYMAHTSGVGTEGWRSPEIVRSMLQESSDNAVIRVSYSSDIFSLGCIFHFVLTRPHGIHPFGDAVHRQVNILNGKLELAEDKITINGAKTSELMKLIRKMTSHAYSERPIASVILTHMADVGVITGCSGIPISGGGLLQTNLNSSIPNSTSNGIEKTDRSRTKEANIPVNVVAPLQRVAVSSGRTTSSESQSLEETELNRSTVNDLVRKFNVKIDEQKPLTPIQSTRESRKYTNHIHAGAAAVTVNKQEENTDLVTDFAICLHSYEASMDDELSFNKGDIIALTSKPKGQVPGDRWYYGKTGGNIGFFPSNYVQIISAQDAYQEILAKHTFNDPAMLQELSDMGIDMDADLHLAAERQDIKLVQSLVNKGHNLNTMHDLKFTPLHSAVFGKDIKLSLEIIRYLIDHGANAFARDIEDQTFLHIFVQGLTPNQFHSFTVYLVAKGLSKLFKARDERGATPFHLAVRYVAIQIETLSILYKNGVQINAVDRLGNSVLFYYVVQSRFRAEFMSDLIRFGGNYEHTNVKKQNLLHITANSGNVDAFKFTLKLGLNVNAVDINGNTPLHTVLKNWEEHAIVMARLLMEKGANANIRDSEGKSSYDLGNDKTTLKEWSAIGFKNLMKYPMPKDK